jgi:hypothetical protein
MDNQNVLVIGGAVVGMFVLGGFFLSGPAQRDHNRPTYTEDDIRYKFQQEDLKKKKKTGTKKTAVQTPTYASGTSSNAGSSSDFSGGDNEEPSVFDHEPQEEPPLD